MLIAFPDRCFLALATISLLALLAGCATTGAGPGATANPAPPLSGSTPIAEKILHDLAANDSAIQNFRAGGKFVLKSPELEEVQILRQSSIRFRRPADLYVVGRKYSKAVFKLTCTRDGFLIVLPTESSYSFGESGASFRGISRTVSPREIANEMFFPEDWAKLNSELVRLGDISSDGKRVVLNIYDSRKRQTLRRKVTVEGSPWHIIENDRYDGDATQPVAVTTLSNFHESSGAMYAATIESRFPAEDAYMQFDAGAYEINAQQEPGDFDLKRQLHEVIHDGYKQIERK